MDSTSARSIKLTPINKPIALDANGAEIQLPKFVNFLEGSKEFTVTNPVFGDIGLYLIGFRLGYAEYPAAQV